MPALHRDYETRSVVNLQDVGPHKYATHPTTEILCCSYCVDDGPVKLWVPGDPVPPEFVEAARNPDWLAYAHNAAFEMAIEAHVLKAIGWPTIPLARQRCTMAMSLALAMPGKLEVLAKALGLEEVKDTLGRRTMLRMTKPRRPRKDEDPAGIYWVDGPEERRILGEYCRQDTRTEREAAHRLRPLMRREQRIWALGEVINRRGVRIDHRLVTVARGLAENAFAEINAELAELTDGAAEKTTQDARLKAWATQMGSPLSSIAKDAVGPLLEAPGLPPRVRRMLELRLEAAQSAVAKLGALTDWMQPDGRARGTFRYHAASPGRFGGSGPQLQNMKRLDHLFELGLDPERDLKRIIAAIRSGDYGRLRALTSSPLALLGSCVRLMLVAEPGARLLGADFGSIEGRVLAWLADETAKLDAFRLEDRGGPKIYAATASRILGIDPAKITKGSREREIGKRCELSFGYQGGVGAWRSFEKAAGVQTHYTDMEIETFKDRWRALHPRIVAFWRALNDAAIEATWHGGREVSCGPLIWKREGELLFCRLPSSRKICYPQPRLVPSRFGGDYNIVHKDNSQGQWRDSRVVYGGMLAEHVTAGTARDLLVEAMWRAEGAGYRVIAHCHDELMAELPRGQGSEAELHAIMVEVPHWAKGLPVTAEAWSGERYQKV
jgi:DNA polymerase